MACVDVCGVSVRSAPLVADDSPACVSVGLAVVLANSNVAGVTMIGVDPLIADTTLAAVVPVTSPAIELLPGAAHESDEPL